MIIAGVGKNGPELYSIQFKDGEVLKHKTKQFGCNWDKISL